jgi:hypothetical protein
MGCRIHVRMREESINRGCMARSGCLLPSSDGVLGARLVGTQVGEGLARLRRASRALPKRPDKPVSHPPLTHPPSDPANPESPTATGPELAPSPIPSLPPEKRSAAVCICHLPSPQLVKSLTLDTQYFTAVKLLPINDRTQPCCPAALLPCVQ